MKRRTAARWTPRPRRHPGRKALAYHEAGHAVVGYAIGLTIERVTIIPDENSLGHCRYREWDEWTVASPPESVLALVLAGAVAEEIATGRPSRASDDRNALGVARATGAGEAEAGERLAAARHRTGLFLEAHWSVVKAVAGTLRERRDLESREAMATLARAFRRLRGETVHRHELWP